MKLDSLWLQRKVKQEASCSAAQLMVWCGLDYPRAKRLLERLIRCGWLAEQSQGLQYPVQPQYLRLRKLRRREAERLYPILTRHEVTALTTVCECAGTDRIRVEYAVRNPSKAEEAISLLVKKRLIYQYGRLYFPCISLSAAVLLQMLMRARTEPLFDENQAADPEMWQRRAQKILDSYYGVS